jgi:ankyrin repeat protein
MPSLTADFLGACETHDADALRAALGAGFDVHAPIDGITPVMHLIEMYLRSPRFPACLDVLLDAGAVVTDSALVPVLRNDATQLTELLTRTPSLVHDRFSMRCTFTPLVGATLLHVAAEYGHREVAEVLIARGADVNARAGVGSNGLNGHTPIFHTVNAHANHGAPLMSLLLAHGARTDVQVAGITWGAGFPWATVCFDVTPVSYAQCGLLRQFKRDEQHIAANVRALLAAAGRGVPDDLNVPNKYLQDG